MADGVRGRSMPVLLLVGAACIVYINSLTNGFALDDVAIIRDNPNVHDLYDWRSIWLKPYWPYFGVEMGLWRPFALFAYAVQWTLGGGTPLIFHAVNILLHALVTVLTFLLLKRLASAPAAFAGSLLFATHPVHTEAVANVVGQAELITAAALLGACLIHASRPAGVTVSWPRRLGMIILFAVAVLTKEHAVVLPGLLLAIDLAQRRIRFDPGGVLEYAHAVLMPLLLLGCTFAAYLLVRISVLEGNFTGTEPGPQYSYLQGEYRLFNALRAFPEFLRLMVFPLDLSADYAPAMVLPVESITIMTAVGAVLLAATAALALLTPVRPLVGFPAAWFLISVITVSNLIFPIGVFIAERTLYLASVAVSAAVALAWVTLRPRLSPAGRTYASVLLVLCVVLFGIRTWQRNPDWQDTNTVLFSIVRDHPESYKAQWTQASWHWAQGRPEVARDHFELATRLYAHDSQLLSEYASILVVLGELDRAVDMLETAFEMHPYVPRTILLLATAYVHAGSFEEALEMARVADRNSIPPAASMPIRAAAYDGMGRTDQAVSAWRYVIRRSVLPTPLAWGFVARRLAELGHTGDALDAITRGRHAAAGDTAAERSLVSVEKAVRDGCYERRSAARGASRISECDPLPPAGSARTLQIPLQNARDAPVEPAGLTAGVGR